MQDFGYPPYAGGFGVKGLAGNFFRKSVLKPEKKLLTDRFFMYTHTPCELTPGIQGFEEERPKPIGVSIHKSKS